MEEENKIFLIQTTLLKKGSSLLIDRANKIESREKELRFDSIGDEEQSTIISIFKVRSLKLSADIVNHISTEIMRDDPTVHYFLMPHVRTLLEVYAHFIHLLCNCSNEKEQALTCLAYQLHTYNKLKQAPEYIKTLDLCKNFLIQSKFSFPDNPDNYSKKWIEKNKLCFKNKVELLVPDNFVKYSTNTIEVFKPQQIYSIYSGFSEFLHGNPYYYKETPHNERFWIVGTCLVILPFIIEMIDTYSLKKINPKDFRDWLNEIKINKTFFTTVWENKNRLK